MTQSGAKEETPAQAEGATGYEAMKEWQRLAQVIADGDGSLETYDETARVLASLRNHRFSRGKSIASSGTSSQPAVPEHFRCSITSELMRDPVVIASGQTYDRDFIQEWLKSGNQTCPRTGLVLSNTILIPNALIRNMIEQWCIEHGMAILKLGEDAGKGALITEEEQKMLEKLFTKISNSSSISEQKEAMEELRSLTKQNMFLRVLMGEKPSTIDQLLSAPGLNHDAELEENTVATLLNVSILESNKKIVGDNPKVIPMLIKALKGATVETRANAAAALFTLSAIEEIRIKIGQLGALGPLVELLESGSLSEKKNAGSAIYNLCITHENRTRAAKEGLVEVLLNVLKSYSVVDQSLAILAMLSKDVEPTDNIADAGGIPCLLSIIRGNSSDRNKENAVTVLFSICVSDRSKLREVGMADIGCILDLANNGTTKARRKANGVIERWGRNLYSSSRSR